ncbi:MAG: hypothetical protein LBM41_08365 [Ruminococcus sp.]|jgi:hypothetical protein|nr:hypothetical protein [Ruminococcus sp.]
MKKLFSAVLALVLAVGTLSVSAFAETKDDGVSLQKEENVGAIDLGSVVELIKFDASRSSNEEVRRQIMMINSDIENSIEADARVADRALSDESYEGNFEIRAYSFETDKYLQYIGTSIEYPTYGRDPYVYSFVYDRANKKYIRLSDALIEDGLTEDGIITDAEKQYFAADQEYLFGGKVAGFYMSGDTRIYLLRMNMINPVADEWITLMAYIPGKYTSDGEAAVHENVKLGDEFIIASIDHSDIKTDHTNDIIMNVKYVAVSDDGTGAENGDYIRFMRDRCAIIKTGDKLSAVFYYRNLDIITFNKLTESFDGTLEGGTKLTIGDKVYIYTAD